MNHRNTLIAASLTFGLLAAAGARVAVANDPCAGYDVACDATGCMVCWTTTGGLVCEDDISIEEIRLTLPGCVNARPTPGLNFKAATARRGNFRSSRLQKKSTLQFN